MRLEVVGLHAAREVSPELRDLVLGQRKQLELDEVFVLGDRVPLDLVVEHHERVAALQPVAADVEQQVALLHRVDVLRVEVHRHHEHVLAGLLAGVLQRRQHAGRGAAVRGPHPLDVGVRLVERFEHGLRGVADEVAVDLARDLHLGMILQRVGEALAPVDRHRGAGGAVDHADHLLAGAVRRHGGEQGFRHLPSRVLVAGADERLVVGKARGLRRERRVAVREHHGDVGVLGQRQATCGGRPVGGEDDAVDRPRHQVLQRLDHLVRLVVGVEHDEVDAELVGTFADEVDIGVPELGGQGRHHHADRRPVRRHRRPRAGPERAQGQREQAASRPLQDRPPPHRQAGRVRVPIRARFVVQGRLSCDPHGCRPPWARPFQVVRMVCRTTKLGRILPECPPTGSIWVAFSVPSGCCGKNCMSCR